MTEKHNLWKPEYALNIDLIDEQHQVFFQICSDLALACEQARDKPVTVRTIIKIMFRLRQYAFKHFYTEEEILARSGYPGIFTQIREHDNFLASVQGLSSSLEAFGGHFEKAAQEDFLTIADEVLDHSVIWWEKHIMEVDAHYAQWARKHKAKTTR